MATQLFLKTLFCCMACDGHIADEEIDLIEQLVQDSDRFASLPTDKILNNYVTEINQHSKAFLSGYWSELAQSSLSETEQLSLLELLNRMIEVDKKIEYAEISFFKKNRQHLTVSDEAILGKLPGCEEYLLPDTHVENELVYNYTFNSIQLKTIDKP
ncbi:MAG: TerB family tellurite resistance protein [Tannerellaceae bacterium]|nr:TerB family tellurite resistance protein [Tannerellaceae bacterium]